MQRAIDGECVCVWMYVSVKELVSGQDCERLRERERERERERNRQTDRCREKTRQFV